MPVKRTFARLTGLVLLLYGAWMFTVNLIEGVVSANSYEPPWILYLVLGFGLAGAIGGAVYLLSLDGPQRFRTRRHRVIGWVGMLICAALPGSVSFVLLIIVAISAGTLLDSEQTEGSSERSVLRSG